MMNCREFGSYISSKVVRLVALLVAVHLFVGCTTEVDYTLGTEYVPTNQNMELKRRVYRAGKMIESGVTTDIPMACTYLYQTDSIKSSNLGSVYFGAEKSSEYGERRAGFMSQVLFGSKLDEEYGWGYRPIFDSMVIALYVTDYHGDTTKSRKFEIYEIISNDYFSLSKDTTFYTNFNPSEYISREPIFTFNYPDKDNGVYVGNIEKPRSCYVTLQNTPTTMEYIRRLMFTTDLASTDGYGLDKDKIYEQGNEEEFVKQIRGVYIAPAEGEIDGEGAMFATDIENSALVLYARSRYKEDPTIIKDTVIMSYNFYISPVSYDVKAGNVSISCVEHELSHDDKQLIEEHSEVLVGKVDGMAGIVTELKFTDEFIQSLADLALKHKDAVVSVNQAHLTIYLEGSEYDYENLNPDLITPIMDDAMSRLGLYARYGGWETDYVSDIVTIADYLYSSESSSVVISYDGYLNRSLGCYKMNVSNFIQSLIMAASSNVDENGKVDYAKFESDSDLARCRSIYVGPAADALYGFNHQRIIGGDVEVDGVKNSSPITLDITYTVVY